MGWIGVLEQDQSLKTNTARALAAIRILGGC
jgi:hypothetical protein